MSRSSIADELPHRVPHRDQLGSNIAQITKGNTASDNTATEHTSIFKPRLLQSPLQSQHQVIDQSSYLHHAQHLLMSLSITAEKNLLSEIAAQDELVAILTSITQHSQQRRTRTLDGQGQLTTRNTPKDAGQEAQLSEGNALTRRLDVDEHFQQDMFVPCPHKTLLSSSSIKKHNAVAFEVIDPSDQHT